MAAIKAIMKKDICDDFKKNDEVEIVPEYAYFFSERIKEKFNVQPGEVVIKKTKCSSQGGHERYAIVKCQRKDIQIIK